MFSDQGPPAQKPEDERGSVGQELRHRLGRQRLCEVEALGHIAAHLPQQLRLFFALHPPALTPPPPAGTPPPPRAARAVASGNPWAIPRPSPPTSSACPPLSPPPL